MSMRLSTVMKDYQFMGLRFLEVWQAFRITPTCSTFASPTIIVESMSPNVDPVTKINKEAFYVSVKKKIS